MYVKLVYTNYKQITFVAKVLDYRRYRKNRKDNIFEIVQVFNTIEN